MALESVNPATGEHIETFTEWTPEQTAETIDRSARAFTSWRTTSFSQRAHLMRNAADVLQAGKETYAKTMALEMGKPIAEGRAEIDKCSLVCRYYADHAEAFLKQEPAESDGSSAHIVFHPLGPVLAVMPWNYPFWQVFRFVAPALMAGNTGLLKHSSNVQRSALQIEEVLRSTGFPEDVFRTLLIGSGQVANVIENRHVTAVTLTGSDAAGRRVAAKAGECLKKTVMELGGSDCFIVLKDVDIDLVTTMAVRARCQNSGQSCIAAKRFIVEEKVHDEFIEKFVRKMEMLKLGNPLEDATQVGPLAREDLREELHGIVARSEDMGAKIATGGSPINGSGYFYPPTIVTQVATDMPVFQEETFGPVAAVVSVADSDEAIARANQSEFGLGGSVWTRNIKLGESIANRLEVGCAFVNGIVKSDPRLPFGGIKASGYGRELSQYGIREFVNVQTIWVA